MGATVTVDKRAYAFRSGEKVIYVLFESAYEKNCYPHPVGPVLPLARSRKSCVVSTAPFTQPLAAVCRAATDGFLQPTI